MSLFHSVVHVREIDLTGIVPAVPTTIGAIAGAFEKGPVGSIVRVGSEEELVKFLVNPKIAAISLKHFLPLSTFFNIQIN